MVTIPCAQCERYSDRRDNAGMYVTCRRGANWHGPGVELRGILTCLTDGHQTPIHIRDDVLRPPSRTSDLLRASHRLSNVPPEIKQDVQDAEQTHFAFAYKSSVVMCRRAIQMSLIEKQMTDEAIGKMLEKAKPSPTGNGVIPEWGEWYRAKKICDAGGAGAHASGDFDPDDIAAYIHDTVQVVNGIFA